MRILHTALLLWTAGCVFIDEDEYAKRLAQADRTGPPGDAPCVETQWFTDADGDGLGDPGTVVAACEAPTGAVDNGDDCDDADPAVLDGIAWFKDVDSDGYGDPDNTVLACDPLPGTVAIGEDCDDGDGGVHPGANENCASNADDDCDGNTNDIDADGCSVFYADADGDEHGGLDEQCLCDGEGAYVLSESSDCDDDDPEVNPDATEICNNGIDDDCDGTPGTCGLNGEQSLADADAVLLGTLNDGRAGTVVSAAGDLTGDGKPDLLVGAYNADGARGRVYLVPGPVSGESSLDSYANWQGEAEGDKLGRDVGTAGDLTGDGITDLVIAAPQNAGGGAARGKIYILAGPLDTASDLASDVDAILLGTTNNALTGRNFDGAGDFDGDGQPDLLLGAIGHKVDGVEKGGAIVVLGPIDGEIDLSTSPDGALIIHGSAMSDQAGRDVAGVGDLNGDGFDDIAIGARYAGGTGAVHVVLGHELSTETLDLADADGELLGDQAGSQLGLVLAAGDVDGDGVPDLALAAPFWDAPEGDDAGIVYIVLDPVGASGSAADSAQVTVSGDIDSGNLGEGLVVLADLDGDGQDELSVGVPGASGGKGEVLLFYSPAAGAFAMADAEAVLKGDAPVGRAGTGLAAAGDLDLDGTSGLLVGAPEADAIAAQEGIVYFIGGGGM
jgi:hypothetical protein